MKHKPEDLWATIRRLKAEADALGLEIRALQLRQSNLANRMQDAYERLAGSLEDEAAQVAEAQAVSP